MPIFHNTKILFIHIPKTVGSSIEKYLEQKENIKLNEEKNVMNLFSYVAHDGLPSSYQHLTYKDIIKFYPNSKDYKIFCCIRNPYDRLVSEYHYQISLKTWESNSELQADFTKFVKFYLGNKSMFDNHKLPQHKFIESCEKEIKILKYENLQEEFKEYFGEELKYHILQSIDRTNYKYYYIAETKEIVYNYYKDDFNIFGYSKEIN